MVNEVHTCLAEIKDRFPGYRGQGYEIAGFVWFQGWNDQYNDRWLSYEANLANLMRDVRAEFKAPDMSIVVGADGSGRNEGGQEGQSTRLHQESSGQCSSVR